METIFFNVSQWQPSMVSGCMHPAVARMMRDPTRIDFQDPECQKKRKGTVTATDVNTLVHSLPIRGENKYRTVTQLIYKKMHISEREENEAIAHGVKHEAEALRLYETATGNKLVEEHIGFVNVGIVGATPDACCRDLPILVEVKCPFYGQDRMSQDVPDIYWPQIQTQMAVAQIPTCHFVRYWPETPCEKAFMNIVEVKFDPDWWRRALVAIQLFYDQLQRYIEGKELLPPPPPAKKRANRTKALKPKKKQRCFV